MDSSVSNVCILHEDVNRAIDQALWMNHKTQGIAKNLFSVIEGPENNYAVVSSDVLNMFDKPSIHKLHNDYTDLNFETIKWIRQDPNPLEHWEEIYGMFSTIDGDILRFIISQKIPLEMFIRHELGASGFDENGVCVGFEKAQEIWCGNESN